MSSRRDFLKGFAALASGIVLAPATALATVQRLGEPQVWVTTSYDGGLTRIWRKVQAHVHESWNFVSVEYEVLDESQGPQKPRSLYAPAPRLVHVVTVPMVLD